MLKMEKRKETDNVTYKEARVYLDEMSKYGSVLGLDTVRQLLCELGNPQDELRFIHIAGTNGKGSVLAFTSTILTEAGVRTGRYISPTVVSYLERIQVDGMWIQEEEFAELAGEVQKAVVRMETKGMPVPTVFEIETAIAFLYFRQKRCEYVVLETGLGGNLDATNIVKNTAAAVFTSISRDHMGFLGDTLEEIAQNKAGIMKPGCIAVSAAQEPEVKRVLEAQAEQCGCPLIFARPEDVVIAEEDYRGMTFTYPVYGNKGSLTGTNRDPAAQEKKEPAEKSRNPEVQERKGLAETNRDPEVQDKKELTERSQSQEIRDRKDADRKSAGRISVRISLGGRHQLLNAAVVLELMQALEVSEEAVRRGFAGTRWPGRFTCIAGEPVFIVDGAHNAAAALRLRESVERYFPGRRLICIMGVFRDKEYVQIAETMLPLADQVYTVELPDRGRTLSAEALKHAAELYCKGRVFAAGSVEKAVELAWREAGKEDVILAFGSLSYLGQVMRKVEGLLPGREMKKKETSRRDRR